MSSARDEEERSSTGEESTGDRTITQAVSTTTQKVVGETTATDAVGVLGRTTAGSSVTYGVVGETDSTEAGATGVRGETTGGSGNTIGVHGKSNGGHAIDTVAVYADARDVDATGLEADATGDRGDGVRAKASEDLYYGVYGINTATSGYNAYGIKAETNSSDAPALYATGNDGGAIETSGNVDVGGDVTVSGTVRKSTGASVYLSSDKTIVSAEYTQVNFDGINTDQRGEFDTGTSVFTCAYAGDYHVDVSLAWLDLPADTYQIVRLKHNGQTVGKEHVRSGSSGFQSISKSKTLFDLSKGDTITVDVYQRSGQDQVLNGNASSTNEYTTLTISQIG